MTRIGVLLPQLEYVLQAAAGGPDLIEEGLEMIHAAAERSGLTAHDVNQRVTAGLESLAVLSDPKILKALGPLRTVPVLL